MPVSRRTPGQAWVITGPTSGIGRYAALELAQHGTVVLVGRDPRKLADLEREINARPNGHAVPVVGDFSDIPSARRAAAEVAALNLPLAGVANNAGLMGLRMSARTPRTGTWSSSPTTSGPFAFTEALLPHLPDGASVVFTCSGVEDPERKPATAGDFRGGRYISTESSARGRLVGTMLRGAGHPPLTGPTRGPSRRLAPSK